MLAFLMTAFATEPVVIKVSDPAVKTVVLKCSDGDLKSDVYNGQVSFSRNPGGCEVRFIRTVGAIDGPGEYTCGEGGCQHVDVIHKPIENAPGRVTVIITDRSTTLLELKCGSQYRVRAPVETNTAVFENVPNAECDMFWKGGRPAKARQITPGTWYCQATGPTGVCTQR